MVRQTRESRSSQERVERRRVARSSGIPEFDGPITCAGQELLVPRPGHALDNVFVRSVCPDLIFAAQIPYLDHTVPN